MGEYIISNKIFFSNKGSYQEKIDAITEKVMLFGGTSIFFNKDAFYFGGLRLFYIKYGTAVFTDKDNKTTYHFGLHSFSDNFLFNLFITYINTCKEQLTEDAFKEIENYLEEKFA